MWHSERLAVDVYHRDSVPLAFPNAERDGDALQYRVTVGFAERECLAISYIELHLLGKWVPISERLRLHFCKPLCHGHRVRYF